MIVTGVTRRGPHGIWVVKDERFRSFQRTCLPWRVDQPPSRFDWCSKPLPWDLFALLQYCISYYSIDYGIIYSNCWLAPASRVARSGADDGTSYLQQLAPTTPASKISDWRLMQYCIIYIVCMYMYIYIYVYIHTHSHLYIYIYIYTHICTYVYGLCIDVCIIVCTYVYTCIHMLTDTLPSFFPQLPESSSSSRFEGRAEGSHIN